MVESWCNMFNWKSIERITDFLEIKGMGTTFAVGYDKSEQEEAMLIVGVRKDNDIYIIKILKGEEAEELYRRLVE